MGELPLVERRDADGHGHRGRAGTRLAFEWDDEGQVAFTLDDDEEGTRLTVVETSPEWTAALDLQASAFARV